MLTQWWSLLGHLNRNVAIVHLGFSYFNMKNSIHAKKKQPKHINTYEFECVGRLSKRRWLMCETRRLRSSEELAVKVRKISGAGIRSANLVCVRMREISDTAFSEEPLNCWLFYNQTPTLIFKIFWSITLTKPWSLSYNRCDLTVLIWINNWKANCLHKERKAYEWVKERIN